MTEFYTLPDTEAEALAKATAVAFHDLLMTAMETAHREALEAHAGGKPGDLAVDVGRIFQGAATALALFALKGGGERAFRQMHQAVEEAFARTLAQHRTGRGH